MEKEEIQANQNSENFQDLQDQYREISSDPNYFETQLPIICETEKAICFNIYSGHLPKEKAAWIPKSQMVIVKFGNGVGEIGDRYFVKNWLASKLK